MATVKPRDYESMLAKEVSPQWFVQWRTIMPLLDARRPKQCLEVGSWMGSSAIPICRLINEWGGSLICVDHWQGSPGWKEAPPPAAEAFSTFLRNMDASGVKNYRILKGSSSAMAKRVPDGSCDFIFIDAAHDYDNVRNDLATWWPKLAPGGVMAGDDYGDPIPFPGVLRAWEEFSEAPVNFSAGKGKWGVAWVEKPR